jgi:hypothetical protein
VRAAIYCKNQLFILTWHYTPITFIRQNERQRLEAAQMRLLRTLLGYIKLDRQRNIDRRGRLKVQSTAEVIQTYQRNWKEHVERKQDERFPKLSLKYQPVGKQSRGRPKKEMERPVLGRELRNTGLVNKPSQ